MSKKANDTTSKQSAKQAYFAEPEENAGFMIWQVSMLWQRKLKNGLDKFGITHAQFLLLASLNHLSQIFEIK